MWHYCGKGLFQDGVFWWVLNLLLSVRKDKSSFDMSNYGREGNRKWRKILIKLIKLTEVNKRRKRIVDILFCRCILRCSSKSARSKRERIFCEFYQLGNHDTQNKYLLNTPCQSVTYSSAILVKRKSEAKYYLILDENDSLSATCKSRALYFFKRSCGFYWKLWWLIFTIYQAFRNIHICIHALLIIVTGFAKRGLSYTCTISKLIFCHHSIPISIH